MKAVSKFVVMLSLGALLSVAVSAMTPEQAYVESCRKVPGVPVPVAVVSPSVDAKYSGLTVQLEFIVDETGIPVGFSVVSSPDANLSIAVMEAVKRWRFKPVEANGKPVATKVTLPVTIVDPVQAPDGYVTI